MLNQIINGGLKMDKQIRYKDLSTPLKVLVVLCWIMVGFYTISFLIGFISGMLLF